MFRKLWKQLKFIAIIVVIIICIPRSILPNSTQTGDIEYYINLNDTEERLPVFKDTREALELKLEQLDIINSSRRRFGAKPVKLDILASRVANKICREAAGNEYIGHWNLAGEKPYQRYAFAGGYDHVSENAYAEWSKEYLENAPDEIAFMMRNGHKTFMEERAPNDGHKQTVIAKDHNFVGIGYYLTGKQFRYYEEFIDRYFEFENIPSEIKPGKRSTITVKVPEKTFLYFMIVYYEKFPEPLTPKEISRRGSYDDFTKDQYQQVYAWDLATYRSGNAYNIPLSFKKEGLYYVQIFSDKKEYTRATNLSTKGKTPYSGIVIRVRN
jgi:uncharacterized protein YkwD